jgi:molybdopterin-guanine dinucleotide biosynthesis protein A
MIDRTLDAIQPVVLVGGRSRRFGRDKLREPIGDSGGWLVDRPIRALREVFGARVAVVGDCDAGVAERADTQLRDDYPGVGPAGGVLAALEQSAGAVFVLAGDLPDITASAIREIVHAASSANANDYWAVMAEAGGVQPVIALYRQTIRQRLETRLKSGMRSLHDVAPPERILLVPIPPACARNVNAPGDMTDDNR